MQIPCIFWCWPNNYIDINPDLRAGEGQKWSLSSGFKEDFAPETTVFRPTSLAFHAMKMTGGIYLSTIVA